MKRNNQIELPGYRVEKVLGKGGMATVYLATQLSLGRPVALKVLNDPETPQFFERFFTEGRCMARLCHNNLVTVHDIGQGDGFYYIVMEYLSGGDLKTRIAQGVKPGQALKTLARLAGCLGYVHGQGIIHRDIKPSNILFRGDGTPVISDFGIAKLTESESDLTMTGTVMGSPHYLSPEQAQGIRELDGRADLYSLGVLLFEMLTGRKPFAEESFTATLIAHIRQPIPQLPPQLDRIQPLVERLLAKKPEERIRSGAELVKEIQQLRTTAPRPERQPKPEPQPTAGADTTHCLGQTPVIAPRWHRLAYAAAILSGLLLWWGLSRDPASQPPAAETTATSSMSTPPLPLPEAAVPGLAEAKIESLAARELPAMEAPVGPVTSLEPALMASIPPAPERENDGSTQALDDIPRWLEQADRRLQENRLSRPRGDSARDFYRKVLEREPGNPRALSGLKQIADRYAWFAHASLTKGKRENALRYIRLGLQTQPGRSDLKALERSLKRQVQKPASSPPPTHPLLPQRPGKPDAGRDEPPLFNIEHNS